MVVLGHFIQLYIERIGGGCLYSVSEALLCLIYFFHMPLFVFVSGLFSKNVAKRRDRAFEDLLIPLLAAQLVWLVFRCVTDGPDWALDHLFIPDFQLWYLASLFCWRLLLPDLLRVRFILPIAVVLCFAVQMVDGSASEFILQRTLGFLFFFLLGYLADAEQVVRYVGRLPAIVAAIPFLIAFAGMVLLFSDGAISYKVAFNILRHFTQIGSMGGYLVDIAAYAVCLIGAILLSACFLRLAMAFKTWKPIVGVGTDTMPIFIIHGWLAYVLCAVVSKVPGLTECLVLPILVLLTAGVTALLSTKFCRKAYGQAISSVTGALMKG